MKISNPTIKLCLIVSLLTILISCGNVKERAYMDGWIHGYLRAHKQFNKAYDMEQAKEYWRIDSSEYLK